MLHYDCNNPFLSKFKFAANRLKICPSLQLIISIITNKKFNKRIFIKSTFDEIAFLIPSDGPSTYSANRQG